jgi:hypothetical protein
VFVCVKALAVACPMGRWQPGETDFGSEVAEHTVVVCFWPTRSTYTFKRFTDGRDVAEFGPVSPDPIEQHPSRGGLRNYNSADVRAMAFRIATRTIANSEQS